MCACLWLSLLSPFRTQNQVMVPSILRSSLSLSVKATKTTPSSLSKSQTDLDNPSLRLFPGDFRFDQVKSIP